jgi:Domain of unknown function (DUF397)
MDTKEGSIQWRRSSRCESDTCVEVARIDRTIAIRDAKDVDGPVLIFSAVEWAAFVAGVRNGEFD